MPKNINIEKVAVIPRGVIPSNSAHSINIMNHANSFYQLGYTVEVLNLRNLFRKNPNKRNKNIHDFYGIHQKIKIQFFNDYSFQNFKDLKIFKYLALKLMPIFANPLRKKETECDNNSYNKKTSKIFKFFFPIILNSLLKLTDIFNSYKKISNYCTRNKIDLVYCRTFEAAYHCIKNNIPTVIEMHWPNIKNPEFRKFIELSNNQFFKAIITIHPLIKQSLIVSGIPSRKIKVLDDAVDLERYSLINANKKKLREELKLPLDKKLLLYTGSLMEGRGIDTIIEAANLLRENNIVFYIIGGSQKEIEKWKVYMKKRKIQAKIIFLSFIKSNLIPLYHKAADILLAPYSIRCETIDWMSPIKLFEYMASKVPIIASDVIRIKEICRNNECLLFKSDDAQDLGNKIRLLIKDKQLQDELIQSAYLKSEENTYKKRCTKIFKEL